MRAVLGVGVGQVVDPAEGLAGLAVGQQSREAVFRAEREQPLKIGPQRRCASRFEGQHVGPAVLFADRQHRSAGQERIGGQTEAGLRKGLFQLSRQPQEGVEFAVLLDRFIVRQGGASARGCRHRVFDELGADRKGQPGRMHDLGFQDRMEVTDAGAVAVFQALRTVALAKTQEAGAVGGHDQFAVEAEAVQHLVAQEPAHAAGAQVGQRG